MKIEQRIGRVDRVGQTQRRSDLQLRGEGHARRAHPRRARASNPALHRDRRRARPDPRVVRGRDRTDRAGRRKATRMPRSRKLDAELEDGDREVASSSRSSDAISSSIGEASSATRRRRLLGRAPRATREDLENFCRAAIGRYGSPGAVELERRGRALRESPWDASKGRQGGRARTTADRSTSPRRCATSGCISSRWVIRSSRRSSTTSAIRGGHRSPLSNPRNGDRRAGLARRLSARAVRHPELGHALISHVVTSSDVRPAGAVIQPSDPALEVELPALAAQHGPRSGETEQSGCARGRPRAASPPSRRSTLRIVEAGVRAAQPDVSTPGAVFIDDRVARNERRDRSPRARGHRVAEADHPGASGSDRCRSQAARRDRRGAQGARRTQFGPTIPSHLLHAARCCDDRPARKARRRWAR